MALKLALEKRREEEEKQRRENEKAYKELLEKSSKQTFTSSSYSSSSYMPSYSQSTRYEKTEGNFDSEFFPFTGYSFSYNNPYSSITDLGNWSQAEAIGIEWDVIDHDYFSDLGLFGDHSL